MAEAAVSLGRGVAAELGNLSSLRGWCEALVVDWMRGSGDFAVGLLALCWVEVGRELRAMNERPRPSVLPVSFSDSPPSPKFDKSADAWALLPTRQGRRRLSTTLAVDLFQPCWSHIRPYTHVPYPLPPYPHLAS